MMFGVVRSKQALANARLELVFCEVVEFFVEALGLAFTSADVVERVPEFGTMVEVIEMGEFVLDDVVDEVAGQEQEPDAEVDVFER